MKKLLPLIVFALSVSGCIFFDEPVQREEVKTGLYKVTETKKEGQEKKVEREEIVRKQKHSPSYTTGLESKTPDFVTKYPLPETSKTISSQNEKKESKEEKVKIKYINGSDYKSEPKKPVASEKKVEIHEDEKQKRWFVSNHSFAGHYGRAVLWTTVSTGFHTETIALPEKWKQSLAIGGEGVDFGGRSNFFKDNEKSFLSAGVRLSGYKSRYERNNFHVGDYYIHENIRTWMTLLCIDCRYYFADLPTYFGIGIGSINFGVQSAIQTNLPEYVYESIEGSKVIFAMPVTLGAAWPKDGRVQLNGEVNLWLPLSDNEIENGVIEVNGGLQYNF